LIGGDADFERLVSGVVASVEAPGTALNLPLDVRGTAFQRRVWQAYASNALEAAVTPR
jgi:AraC family transcriptional regulator of adaptative response/methylated-DNA-[protein]-cysteine methyltransferase